MSTTSTSAADDPLLAAAATGAATTTRDSLHRPPVAILALARHHDPRRIKGAASPITAQPLRPAEEATRCYLAVFIQVSPTRENAWAQIAPNTHPPPRAAPKAVKLMQLRETAWGDAADLRRSPQQDQ